MQSNLNTGDWADTLSNMAALFQGQKAAGDDVAGPAASPTGGSSNRFESVERRGEAHTQGFGTMGYASRIPRNYDVVAATRRMPRVHVTSNAVMEPAEFARHIAAICHAIGLGGEGQEARREAVHQGVVKYFSLNGSSVQAPGRADLVLEGAAGPVSASAYVITHFGDGLRRGARCVADEILIQRRNLYDKRAYLDDDELFEVDLMDIQAANLGLERYPWLAFDVADYCTSRVMSFSERSLVRQAKSALLGTTVNTADRVVVGSVEQAAAGGGAARGISNSHSPAGGAGFAY